MRQVRLDLFSASWLTKPSGAQLDKRYRVPWLLEEAYHAEPIALIGNYIV